MVDLDILLGWLRNRGNCLGTLAKMEGRWRKLKWRAPTDNGDTERVGSGSERAGPGRRDPRDDATPLPFCEGTASDGAKGAPTGVRSSDCLVCGLRFPTGKGPPEALAGDVDGGNDLHEHSTQTCSRALKRRGRVAPDCLACRPLRAFVGEVYASQTIRWPSLPPQSVHQRIRPSSGFVLTALVETG